MMVVILCLVWVFVPVSYAVPEVVYKQPRPEKDLEVEKPAGPQKAETETEKKERYIYNPAGKTDPFESFLAGPKKGGKGATSLSAKDLELKGEEEVINKEPQTELEKIEISNLTLTAVIKGKSKLWAMVIDPKGRGYFLEKGTKIGMNSGVVDEIICGEKETPFGVETVRKVIIKVPYRDRDRNIIYRSIEMEMAHTS